MDDAFQEIAALYGTPCWVYDVNEIKRRIASLRPFDVIRYAQKANSNTHLLALLRSHGIVVDAVSMGEISRAIAAGYQASWTSSEIVYASDILDRPTLKYVAECGIPVNVGSPQMLTQLGSVSRGHRVWLRINPGFGSGFSRKTNTGGEFSKHGIWHENLEECYRQIGVHELNLVGLHMHIGSGASFDHLKRVCDAMVEAVRRCPLDIQAISAGGGLPITHKDTDNEFDVVTYHQLWSEAKAEIEKHLGHPVTLEIEPGRYIVGNAGYLLSEVRAMKEVGPNRFILLDAGFNDLVRPAMYGGYHQIDIVGKRPSSTEETFTPSIVAGPLCEAGDVFTQGADGMVGYQQLPQTEVGDLAVFRDSGAYCSSMSSNYNSRPLAPEVFLDGKDFRLIRRRQNFADLLQLEQF
ncbi:diaminopimelate decarboxylase [Rhizobium sp. CNPSo 4039]|uniref:diaminopimelate decarboxylase n=1 Tax=Rhizobium sp. CNPSo 4039 TaxID=3021409 RepID=UPI00254A1188|nr:diaminopimelate decarboxylase [Rhizobium sp. CNPSo 4039]MDK4717627.1 diaminopimelate decarboxylase [Rhizobium sp. CNPSo 4039]